jgi:biopolymer transport protein ExbB/biopolymer transport protein TolQ
VLNADSFFEGIQFNSQEKKRKTMLVLQLQVWSLWLLQEASVGWDVRSLWGQMGALAKAVVIGLFFMSAWSIGVMIDRFLAYNAARKQSRAFAPAVAGALREGKLDEAVKIADRYKKSHLAKVVVAGLQEFQAHQMSTEIPGEEIEASKRALERAEAIVHAELKRGVSGLATIGSTAPFVGLFGTVVGIINAFQGISSQKSTGLGAVAGGISEALVTTAIGLFVAIPAVWMFNLFTGRIEAFDVEMGNSSSELIDYFLKRSQRVRK